MLAELIKSFLPKQDRYNDPRYWIELFKAKVGGKYLKRWQVTNPRTGKKSWKYKYKPLSQRGAHEITLGKFKKVTKIADETHKAAVEKALQEGHSISMHILKDYPDLIKKYNKSAKVAKFDHLKSKVKDAMSKRAKPETVSEPAKPEPVNVQSEPVKPKSSSPELDKARAELNPKQKWISLKAILNKAQKSGKVPDGLEAEVKQAGRDYVNHVMGGDWTDKSPVKSFE